ncbi:MAG: sodium-dependent transporter [Mangrovibacterium sp.]
MSKYKKEKRAQFSSKFGVIAAAAGSAVGLGNIWKFPYITGKFGGAAFLLVYICFIAIIGVSIMLSEFIIGRRSKKNAYGAYKKLAPKTKWKYVGLLGIIAAILIMAFYVVVAGWTIEYVVAAIGNKFANQTPEQLNAMYADFVDAPFRPLLYQLIFMIITAGVIIAGVKNGIERGSKFMMPLLLVIILILDIRAITLPGAAAGLEFLFKPDFSKLSSDAILSALGHAFFSLSIGTGTLTTYGSYINKKNNLVRTTVDVTIADTVVAILAGVAILPAVFSFGINPSEGPGLVFVTLPNIFLQIKGGYIFSVLFFVLLALAALTSAISILEVIVAYFSEELKMKRKAATIWSSVIILLAGTICSLSMGPYDSLTIGGLNLFDATDWLSTNILLPIGGMFMSLFVGWKLGKVEVLDELAQGSHIKMCFVKIFIFITKFIAPLAILAVFLHGLGII